MNKNFIQILSIVSTVLIYAENKNSNIKAEYCLYEDSSISEFSVIPARHQLRISRFIESLDEIKLQKEKIYCSWVGTDIYILANNNIINPIVFSGICIHCGIKRELTYAFSSINPHQFYGLHYKKDFDTLDFLAGKEISIKWIKTGYCNGKEDSIAGNYHIKIKGKCSEEDLLWNAKYDINKIPSPIDTLDIQEILEENDIGHNKFKMFPYENFPITPELLEMQKARNEKYKEKQKGRK